MGNRWVVVAIFGALFAALFAIVGVATGIGHPSVPAGAVAVVEDAPNGTISKADFDAAVQLSRWVLGEAQDRGIVISDTEITNQLSSIAKQQFGSQQKFQQYLKQAGFTPQQARD